MPSPCLVFPCPSPSPKLSRHLPHSLPTTLPLPPPPPPPPSMDFEIQEQDEWGTWGQSGHGGGLGWSGWDIVPSPKPCQGGTFSPGEGHAFSPPCEKIMATSCLSLLPWTDILWKTCLPGSLPYSLLLLNFQASPFPTPCLPPGFARTRLHTHTPPLLHMRLCSALFALWFSFCFPCFLTCLLLCPKFSKFSFFTAYLSHL